MPTLDFLIERAREYRKRHGFSEEERERQVRSFAYGNTRLENDRITMVDIDKAVEFLKTQAGNPLRLPAASSASADSEEAQTEEVSGNTE